MIFCKNAVLLVLALCSSVAAFSPSSPSAVSVRKISGNNWRKCILNSPLWNLERGEFVSTRYGGLKEETTTSLWKRKKHHGLEHGKRGKDRWCVRESPDTVVSHEQCSRRHSLTQPTPHTHRWNNAPCHVITSILAWCLLPGNQTSFGSTQTPPGTEFLMWFL